MSAVRTLLRQQTVHNPSWPGERVKKKRGSSWGGARALSYPLRKGFATPYQNGFMPIGKTYVSAPNGKKIAIPAGHYRLGSGPRGAWSMPADFARACNRALRFARSARAAREFTIPAHLAEIAREMSAHGLLTPSTDQTEGQNGAS